MAAQTAPLTQARVPQSARESKRFRSRFLNALALILVINVVGTLGYMLIEGWPLLDALFMTVITETTIGYGETHPLSPTGRMFTILLIAFALGTIGYAASIVAEFIVQGELNHIIQGQRMDKQIAKLSDHIILCGAGLTGRYIAEELHKTQTPFVVIDRDEAKLHDLESLGDILHVHGEATEDEILRRAGIERAKGLVAALSDDRDSVFVVLSARALNPNLRIVTRVIDEENAEKLRKAGANETISPNRIGGLRMASVMIRPAVVTFLDEMLRSSGQVLRVEEINVDGHSWLAGKELAQANIEQRTGLLVVALKSAERGYEFNPSKQTVLKHGDVLIVMGPRERLSALQQITPA